MQKQTVSERYTMTKKMNAQIKPTQHILHDGMSVLEQQTILLCNQLQQSLLEAHQSVQQMLTEYPESHTAHAASLRMTSARQLMQQLNSAIPKTAFPLSKSTTQQLKQLEYQIDKANGTLQMIQQSFEAGIST